jgi:glucosylceramidase
MRAVTDLNERRGSRRAFLRRAASSSVLAMAPRWLRSQCTANQPATLYLTDAVAKYAERTGLQWTGAAARVRGATVEIDSTLEYQPILGFGAALTEASCFLLHGMPAEARHAFLTETNSPLG